MADFDVKDGAILYALGALKNVGVAAMENVVSVREQGGPFTDLYDFARRVDTRIVNKRALENLARGGAFDCLEPNRAKALAAASDLQSIGNRASDERNSAQGGLFGDAPDSMEEKALPDTAPWSDMKVLEHELNAVGFYLSGHPLDGHMAALTRHTFAGNIDATYGARRGPMVMKFAGVVTSRQERLSKRGKRFCYLGLSDPTGAYEVFVGEDLLMTNRDIMQVGMLVEVAAKVEARDGEIKIFSNAIHPLDTNAQALPKQFTLYLKNSDAASAVHARLMSFSDAPAQSKGRVHLVIPIDDGREFELQLAGQHSMDTGVYNALRSVIGVEKIEQI